jgi:hypothetical protein
MPKVIQLEKVRKRLRDEKANRYNAYQKKREAEREAQLEKEREKLKKKEFKFNFTTPKKDWSIYGGWVNPFEPINKGRLGSTQEWRKEKPKRHYY